MVSARVSSAHAWQCVGALLRPRGADPAAFPPTSALSNEFTMALDDIIGAQLRKGGNFVVHALPRVSACELRWLL